jgi:transcription antitermination factor NusG
MTADEARIMQEQAIAARELEEAWHRYATVCGDKVTLDPDAFSDYDAAFHRMESLRAELDVARGQTPC